MERCALMWCNRAPGLWLSSLDNDSSWGALCGDPKCHGQ